MFRGLGFGSEGAGGGSSSGGQDGLTVVSSPSQDLARTNRVYICAAEFQRRFPTSSGHVAHCVVNDTFVYTVQALDAVADRSVAIGNVQRRELHLVVGDVVSVVPFQWASPAHARVVMAATFEVEPVVKRHATADHPLEVDHEQLSKLFQKNAAGAVLGTGQSFVIDFYGTSVLLRVVSLLATDGSESVSRAEFRVSLLPQLYFCKAPGSFVKVIGGDAGSGGTQPRQIFRADFEFEKLGIGGLDDEFSQIFRRAFASRVYPPSVIAQLGISHVKGMLLYGPPGTGKTLIARQIGKMLNGSEPQVVNGPEILNKMVGQSEENIRKLFEAAEEDYKRNGEGAELHIIIFDEIDAICKKRGSTRDSTGVGDTVVNQLLSKIDGVNALNNILVIGMTNRKDMIDDALLRPGRLEVHVEISLPDEAGRLQILSIHTAKMRENNMLAPDVALQDLAGRTQNYSGAEIEGLCKSAAAFALNRHVDFRRLQQTTAALKTNAGAGGKGAEQQVVVQSSDFDAALLEVRPAFGMGSERLERCLLGGFILHGLRQEALLDAARMFVSEVQHSRRNPLMSVLIEGAAGTGKTALAAKLALESRFPFVRFVSPEEFVGYGEASKCAALAQLFDDAHKSSLSVLVLDDVERMIEYAPIGPRFSNVVLQTLMVLVKTLPPHGRRLLILATTSSASVLHALQLEQCFNATLRTNALEEDEMRTILAGAARVQTIGRGVDAGVTTLHEREFDQFSFESTRDLERCGAMLAEQKLGIKKLLMLLELAASDTASDSTTAPNKRVVSATRLKEALLSL